MTKMNWQRANERDRYLRSLYAEESDETDLPYDTLNLDNPVHNPLGLVFADFSGQMPSESTRLKIFKHLIANDKALRDRCSVALGETDTKHISSKKFVTFAHQVLMTSLGWPNDKCPVQNLLACSVCFAILYLSEYNRLVGKGQKAIKLTPEIFGRYQMLVKENLIEIAKHVDSTSSSKRVTAKLAVQTLKKSKDSQRT
jgi:hypothetical protein